MAAGETAETRYRQCRDTLEQCGQGHVLRWWAELDASQRSHLLDQIEAIPWDVVDPLIQSHVLRRPMPDIPTDLQPAPVYPCEPGAGHKELYEEARALGRELIAAGKVAAFTVAGGQGTRLGYDGPKGMVAVTPVGDRTLFCIFAETIKAVRDRHHVSVPWYIMTSAANHIQTLEYLRAESFFGLPEGEVSLFPQAMLPALDFDGRLVLTAKHDIALAPDGHGGSLKALAAAGALANMRLRGIEIISYFQVDNPLVKPFDPLFIGLHAKTGSEMSTKVAAKTDDLERVGNVCVGGGTTRVIEYSDLPDSIAHARNPAGGRKFNAGNLAIHLLDVSFIERITDGAFALPYRRAEKVVPTIDDAGARQTPGEPNAVKLETFVFDALPMAKQPLVLEVERGEEFSPVKNPTGVDSIESAKRDQNRRACRWLEEAGVNVPRASDGEADVLITIAPSFAIDAEEVLPKTKKIPRLVPEDHLLLT